MSTRAAIYLRQSLDRTGEELAIDRQRQACRKIAEQRGWQVVDEYVDNSISASKKNAKRPAYERMERDYRSGRFDALVCWDLDRLTRQPRQLEDWIEAAEERGLLLTTANGEADLSTDNGQLFARIKASVARSEVDRKSSRQRAANAQRAEAGKPHAGRRAFGYRKDGMKPIKSEAAVFRRCVEEVLAGRGLRTITADLTAQGITTTAGNPWKPTELRRLLQNPRHAGLRVHRGQVVGEGSWPAIIDEDTHRAVVAVLSDPARTPKGRPRVYLLSGVARCGLCGARVYGRGERRGPIYVCESHAHLGRKSADIDALVEAVVIERLSRDDAAAMFAPADSAPRLAKLRRKDKRISARLDGLAAACGAEQISLRQLTTATARLRAKADKLSQELASLAVAPALAPLVRAADVRAAWDAMPMETRREAIAVLATVTVMPAGRGARVFDPETVRIDWRTA